MLCQYVIMVVSEIQQFCMGSDRFGTAVLDWYEDIHMGLDNSTSHCSLVHVRTQRSVPFCRQ